MSTARGFRGAPAHCGGFAILLVLWVLVLIAFIVGHVAATARSELKISTNIEANAAASAAVDGAVYHAIFDLSELRLDQRWIADGSVRELRIGDSIISLRVNDEAVRINPNLASASLLEGLLLAVGTEQETAADLADGITQWVGSARRPRSVDELLAEYRAAGLVYAPPQAPLESIDELIRVRGMSAEVLEAIRPHLTLFGPREPSAIAADSVVAAAVAFADRSSARTSSPIMTGVGADAVTARIVAVARGPGNAEVKRTVVARISAGATREYSILSWGR